MSETRRGFIRTAAGVAVAGLAGCLGGDNQSNQNENQEGGGGNGTTDGSGTGGSGSTTKRVVMRGTQFQTQTLNVEKGTKVVWVNEDSYPHTVTAASDNWQKDSRVSGGGKTSFTFEKSGVYEVTCKIHPSMSMKVVVGDAQTSSSGDGSGGDGGQDGGGGGGIY
ncbi:MAG: plastocyanin/azurin family copper-binding protein [Halobacteria archaeon]|nr:plastocyanin/azurin family copper-binding protein [Halobacteria archaeon]